MAFTDWDTSFYKGGSQGWVGGDDASQQINSALSSPLTLNGNDARKFKSVTGNNGDKIAASYRLDATLYPEFTAIPDTKAVSVRAWVRVEAEASSSDTMLVGIAVKAGGVAPTLPGGYLLVIGRGAAFALNQATGLTMAFIDQTPIVREEYNSLYAVAADTWYQIRLDVIPTLNGAIVDRDTIRAYINTGSEATPVWTLLREEIVQNVDAAWIPWGDATRTRVGFVFEGRRWGVERTAWIDGFEAKLKNR